MRTRLKLAALGLLALVALAPLALRLAHAPAPSDTTEIVPLLGPRVGPAIGPHIGPTPRADDMIVAEIGDSNTVGQMDVNKASAEFTVTTPVDAIPYDMYYATASSDPPTFIEFGPTTLRNYGGGGGAGAGFELTLGKQLLDIGRGHYLLKMGISGTTTAQWAPASTYMQVTTGKNLYATWRDRVRSFQSSTGRRLTAVVVNLGTNDAASSSDANAMATNMGAIVTQIASDFGSSIVVVWIETHSATTNTFTSTVRTQQTTYASTAPTTFQLINIDDGVLLGDGLHYDADTYLTVGQRAAFAVGDLLAIPRRSVGSPTIVGYGTTAYGNSSVTPRYWPGTQAGDVIYAFVQSGWLVAPTGSTPTPSGWTAEASGQDAAGGVTMQYALFSRALSSGDFTSGRGPAVTFATPGSENSVQLFTWRGASGTDASVATVSNTFGLGPITATGVTTTGANRGIAVFAGGFTGTGTGTNVTVTNATIAGFAEVKDAEYPLPDTNFQQIAAWSGTFASAGATGSSSVSYATNSVPAIITLAVKP